MDSNYNFKTKLFFTLYKTNQPHSFNLSLIQNCDIILNLSFRNEVVLNKPTNKSFTASFTIAVIMDNLRMPFSKADLDQISQLCHKAPIYDKQFI